MAFAVSVLPTPGGTEQEKRADRAPRSEAARVAPQDAGDAREGLAVADDRAPRGAARGASIRAPSVSRSRSTGTPRVSQTTSATCSRATLALRLVRRARAPARSSTLTALSGSARSGMYRDAPSDGRCDRVGAEANPVVPLERRRDSLEGEDGLVGRELRDLDSRHAPGERRVGDRRRACSPRPSSRRCTRAPRARATPSAPRSLRRRP